MTDYRGKLRLLEHQPVKLRHTEDLARPIWPRVLLAVWVILAVTFGLVVLGAQL